jgi:hypothetical protein
VGTGRLGGALAADDVERWINSDSHSSEEEDDSIMVPLLPAGVAMQDRSQSPPAVFVVKRASWVATLTCCKLWARLGGPGHE